MAKKTAKKMAKAVEQQLPLRKYKCTSCGTKYEKNRFDNRNCPSCGKNCAERIG